MTKRELKRLIKECIYESIHEKQIRKSPIALSEAEMLTEIEIKNWINKIKNSVSKEKIKRALEWLKNGLKQEWKESKEMVHIWSKMVRGEPVTAEEKKAASEQLKDIAKVGFWGIIGISPLPEPIEVPIVLGLAKLFNIDMIPSAFKDTLKYSEFDTAGGDSSQRTSDKNNLELEETFQKHLTLLHKKLKLNENVDINQVASTLEFKPVTKQKLVYKYVENGKPGSMAPMTYTKSTVQQPVVTTTADGKETQNTAEVGDIIMSGATGENYVIKAAKLPKLYNGTVGKDIYPEQSPRQVALYSGEPVTFKAPWGEDMVIKPGDYLVKDPANNGYYRIAKVEFEKTYNKL